MFCLHRRRDFFKSPRAVKITCVATLAQATRQLKKITKQSRENLLNELNFSWQNHGLSFVACVATLQLFPYTRDATKAHLANKVQERNRGFGFSKWQPLSPAFVACVATTAHWWFKKIVSPVQANLNCLCSRGFRDSEFIGKQCSRDQTKVCSLKRRLS